MKKRYWWLGMLALLGMVHAEPLRVVTSIPDLAEFTRTVGGAEVEVSSIATGREDPHQVAMRPSMIAQLAKADLYIEMGYGLEHSYSNAMLQESRNTKLLPGQSGYLALSRCVKPLEVPRSLDRSNGDVHPDGNPHYNLDPVAANTMVSVIAEKLSQLRPEGKAQFKANAHAFHVKMAGKIREWSAKMRKGAKFVSYHPDLSYFAKCFGLQCCGTIQPKPGIEPGAKDIENLAQTMQREGVKLILKESFYSDRNPKQLAKLTGARVVSIPIMVNGTPRAKDYFAMMDELVNAISQGS